MIVHVPVAGSPLKTTLPVGKAHEEGCVVVSTIGVGGAPDAGFMTTFAVGCEVHPVSAVTVKLYVPGIRFVTVVLKPVPAIDPGLIVHVPLAGSPLNSTLPVGAAQEEGWVNKPSDGIVGVGEVIVVFTPVPEAQPPTEIVRLL